MEYVGGKDDRLTLFKCRVGHAYTLPSLEAEHAHATEVALWAAVRALEESHYVAQRMADHPSK